SPARREKVEHFAVKSVARCSAAHEPALMSPSSAPPRPRSAAASARAPRRSTSKRPGSAAAASKWGGRQIGQTPWTASIGGGIHASYSAIGQPQVQPILADPRRSSRSTPPAPAAPGFELKVAIPSAEGLVDKREMADSSQRRLTFCPRMRAKGYCRLPSCNFVHEVSRPRREFDPLYCANAPRTCGEVPCRFMAVLGCCPHGDGCVYSHATMPPLEAWVSGTAKVQDSPVDTFGRQTSNFSETDPRILSPTSSSGVVRPLPAKKAPGLCRRPRSAVKQKPTLPQMAFLGSPPDLGCPGKDRPISGGVPVLNMTADRQVTVTAG
ncbi:unnamed protein product, partial [Effrenium voratum]